jgi:hypothetical protein
LGDQTERKLEKCEEKVNELKAENAQLRESAESFGALADRLNEANRAQSQRLAMPCPGCGVEGYVEVTAPTTRGHDVHCTYCGNVWRGTSPE